MILQNKVTLVTGVESEIGRAIAVRFAREGSRIVGCCKSSDSWKETLRAIEDLGSLGMLVEGDVSRISDAENLVSRTRKQFGRLDVLVNYGAGRRILGTIMDVSDETWHEDSVFVPPDRWFHQYFNTSSSPTRYIAFHGPKLGADYGERVENRQRDQIEYPDEEPWIREKFESELAQKGLRSVMPKEAYRDRDFQWHYREE